jgi:hypothetical protein
MTEEVGLEKGTEPFESADDQFWLGQDRDRVRRETCAGSVRAWKMRAGKGSFFFGQGEPRPAGVR